MPRKKSSEAKKRDTGSRWNRNRLIINLHSVGEELHRLDASIFAINPEVNELERKAEEARREIFANENYNTLREHAFSKWVELLKGHKLQKISVFESIVKHIEASLKLDLPSNMKTRLKVRLKTAREDIKSAQMSIEINARELASIRAEFANRRFAA